MQANTDALVIDQTNNPGGNLCLGSDVVSFFLKEPTVLPLFIVKPTRNRVNTYEREYTAYEYQYNNSKEKTRADRKKLAALRRFIGELHSALAEGKEFTHPFHLCNPLDRYNPYTNKEGNNIHYSKPVLILTDETSCSMGDYFPAAMQDAGVAKLFGHRTAGCGGNVLGFSRLGYSDIGIRITESLMVRQRPGALLRLEDQVIENVGVQPDFPYDPSAQDFRNGYPQYRKAIVEAVLELIE